MKLLAEHRLACEGPKEAKAGQARAERELGRRRFEAARKAIHGPDIEPLAGEPERADGRGVRSRRAVG